MTNFILSLTPGPAVMLVTGHSLANGWRRSQFSVLGIMSGNATYCLLSALGLGTLFVRLPILVTVVKGVGALYLIWIGLRSLMHSNAALVPASEQPRATPFALYRQALVLQLSNPKSVLFFCALLPQFVPPGVPAILPMLALGLCAIVLEYPVLTSYSLLGDRTRRFMSSPLATHSLNVLAGGLLIAAAGRVASL
ncbi:LysE family translocator [Massilia horti]|nr:LysE family translocator [Massilia horti]